VASGGRVCVGNFNTNGLKVNDDNDDNDNDNIGRALARNFCLPFLGSSWNRVGKIGVSGREHARARKRERTRISVVTRPEGKVMMRA
jgi:hypothetical protein